MMINEKPEQMTLFDIPKAQNEVKNAIRRWENAFQKWSDNAGQDGLTSYGVCGYGSMCEWCEDNSYGRPCARALNAMFRERRLKINYSERDFKKIWRGVE